MEHSIGGVFAYAAPRCGDAESARILADLYPRRAFWYAHASDLVRSDPLGGGLATPMHASETSVSTLTPNSLSLRFLGHRSTKETQVNTMKHSVFFEFDH